MKILFCGDLVGRAGRDVVLKHLPELRDELGLDFVVVNAENAAHGFGLTGKICDALFEAGADAITLTRSWVHSLRRNLQQTAVQNEFIQCVIRRVTHGVGLRVCATTPCT